MIRYVIFSMIGMLANTALTAQTTRITFDHPHQLLNKEALGTVMPLYKYQSDTVYYWGKSYVMTLPANLNFQDTAFAFTYFTGWKDAAIPKNTLLLIGNYQSESPLIYVDYNQNLDLSDDGAPLTFTKEKPFTVVKLRNSEVPEGIYAVRFSPVVYKDETMKEKVRNVFSNHPMGKGNTMIDIENWFSEKHMRYLITEGKLGEDSVKIGLFDVNSNGLYNDVDEDRILVGNYETGIVSDRFSEGAVAITPNTLVEINEKFYEVVHIDPAGKYIDLQPTDQSFQRLKNGDTIPDLLFKSIKSDSTHLYDYLSSEKYTLLDIWGTWCKGCTFELPKLKELDSLYTNLNIIGLNFKDAEEKAIRYIEEHKIKWFNGYADENIIKTLLADAFPFYILIDDNKKIVKMYAKLEEVEALLSQEK